MKKLALGLVLAVLMAVGAQAEQGVGLGLAYRDSLIGPVVNYTWMFSKYVGVEARVSYLTGEQDVEVKATEEHFQNGNKIRTAIITIDGDMDVDAIPLEAALRFVYPGEKCTPYLLFGGGYYIYDGDVPSFGLGKKTEAESAPGFFGALGVEVRLKGKKKDNMTLFAEIQYTMAQWEVDEEYSGSRSDFVSLFRRLNYDYTGHQKAEGGLDGVGGIFGVRWKL